MSSRKIRRRRKTENDQPAPDVRITKVRSGEIHVISGACRSGRNRRVSPVGARFGEGLLSEHTAGIQLARRELVFMPRSRHPAPFEESAELGGERSFAAAWANGKVAP